MDEKYLQQRIKKREEEERARERELILAGKLKNTEESMRDDRLLQLHQQIEDITNQHKKKGWVVKRKTSTKVRWRYMVHKLHINTKSVEESKKEETTESLAELADDLEQYVIRVKQDNPIYDAFENANDVDDLYRIAESVVNSALTG